MFLSWNGYQTINYIIPVHISLIRRPWRCSTIDRQCEWTSIVIPMKINSSTISFKSDKAGSQSLGCDARFFVICWKKWKKKWVARLDLTVKEREEHLNLYHNFWFLSQNIFWSHDEEWRQVMSSEDTWWRVSRHGFRSSTFCPRWKSRYVPFL